VCDAVVTAAFAYRGYFVPETYTHTHKHAQTYIYIYICITVKTFIYIYVYTYIHAGLWTSTMTRAISTARNFLHSISDNDISVSHCTYKALAEIDVGICDSLTYEQVEHQHPGTLHHPTAFTTYVPVHVCVCVCILSIRVHSGISFLQRLSHPSLCIVYHQPLCIHSFNVYRIRLSVLYTINHCALRR
jgi:hypothetical protein